MLRGKRDLRSAGPTPLRPAAISTPPVNVDAACAPEETSVEPISEARDLASERMPAISALEAENAALRQSVDGASAQIAQLLTLAEDRRRLYVELAAARGETARYRDIVIDIENNAMPPVLDGAQMIDDLKLIVGVGPVLERMLHHLGVTSYRQIARWSDRDIDDFDARLPEFPGRIRRDGWVTQARALHQSKFGEMPHGR